MQKIYEDPNKPGVYGAEHGAMTSHGLLDRLYIVQQPAKLHRAEVGAEREARFILQQHKIPFRCTPTWIKTMNHRERSQVSVLLVNGSYPFLEFYL